MLRNLVPILVALCLGGCGMVSSDRPLFGPLDARGAPVLKPGLWALVQPGCKFNLRSSPKKWPDCAQAAELHDGVAVLIRQDTKSDVEHETTYLLAAGDPAILQVQGPKEEGRPRAPYVYFGIRPLASDLDGVIIRARIWPAYCARPQQAGVPAAPRAKAKPAKALAGLVPGKGPNANCLARGQAPVRNAVTQSEAWAFTGEKDDGGVTAYWVHEPSR
jgi:hypothetical protein